MFLCPAGSWRAPNVLICCGCCRRCCRALQAMALAQLHTAKTVVAWAGLSEVMACHARPAEFPRSLARAAALISPGNLVADSEWRALLTEGVAALPKVSEEIVVLYRWPPGGRRHQHLVHLACLVVAACDTARAPSAAAGHYHDGHFTWSPLSTLRTAKQQVLWRV